MLNSITLEGYIIRRNKVTTTNNKYRIEFDICTETRTEKMEITCKAFDSNALSISNASKGDLVVIIGFLEPSIYKDKQKGIVLTAVSLRVIPNESKGLLDYVKSKTQTKIHQLERGSQEELQSDN